MDVTADVTGRRQAEDALRASEEKYRDLVENASSIILRMDTAGNITFFNEFAQRFFGYGKDEIVGRNVVGTIVPPSDAAGRDWARMIADIGHHPYKYAMNENENMRRNGERVWVAWTNRGVLEREGRTTEILCVGIDVTARKRAEEALAEQTYIVTQACWLLGTDTGALYRLQEDVLSIEAARGLPPEYVAEMDIPYGGAMVGRAVKERRPVVVPDMTGLESSQFQDDPIRQRHLAWLTAYYRGIVAVPLVGKDESPNIPRWLGRS